MEEDILQEKKRSKAIAVELFLTVAFGIIVYLVAGHYDLLEVLVKFSREHEDVELDELLTLSIYLVFSLSLFSLLRWSEARKAAGLLRQNNKELQKALDEIEHLQGILPICANCKNIRDDKGYWHEVEVYIREHTPANFSHSICPECFKRLYPELADEKQ